MEIIDDKKVYKATHRGYLNLGEKEIACAVLENEQRVISQTYLFDAFDRPRKGEKRLSNVPSIIGAKNLERFITNELIEKSQIIYYKASNGRVAQGYNAEIIPLICDLYIEAKNSNELHISQEKLYERSIILIRSLAKVGITALIDEATGFQYDRESKALQDLLRAYISEDLMKWQRRFPATFYKEIFRLYKLPYNPNSTDRPGFIGHFTNQYVYDLFPKKVMDEIRKKNPVTMHNGKSYRKNRYFQYLTTDIGIPQLDNHIAKLLGVMKLSNDMESFKNNFKIAFEEEILKKREDENRESEQCYLFKVDDNTLY